jgi:hypothetical protein
MIETHVKTPTSTCFDLVAAVYAKFDWLSFAKTLGDCRINSLEQ